MGARQIESRTRAAGFAALLVVASVASFADSADGHLRMAVSAGGHVRVNTPVMARIPDGKIPTGAVHLVEITAGQRNPLPCQLLPEPPVRLTWVLTGTTPAHTTRTFELMDGASDTLAAGITIEKDGRTLDIVSGDASILRYNHAMVSPPEGVDARYTRSGFIHPLWSPAGEILTRIHPKDHYHHLGLWHPWTKTRFEGKEVDFWNLGKGLGTVRFAEFTNTTSGPVCGGFTARQEHVALKTTNGEKTVLDESFEVRAWNTGGTEGGWLVDYAITQTCVAETPLTLVKYRYGGFVFRGRGDWDKTNSDYLTSEGKTRKDGHTTRSRWCIVGGDTPSGAAGLLFMSHPDNHVHPEPMRIWPQAEIFFNYCPIQAGDWVLEPGKPHTQRYRVHVFDGKLPPEDAERIWQDFGHPPTVTIQ